MTTSKRRPLKDWEAEYTDRVVLSVNAVRRARGWAIWQLRSELEAQGWALSVDTLNGILSSRKRKSLSVGEVLCFAAALEVPVEFLLLGLPEVQDLPRHGPVPDPAVTSALRWMRGYSDSVYVYPVMHWLTAYGDLLSDLRSENAIWEITGGARERYGSSESEESLIEWLFSRIADLRREWQTHIEAGAFLPLIPELPPELVPFIDGDAPPPSEPIRELLDRETLEAARADLTRVAAARAEVSRMERARNRGSGGEAADADQ